MSSSTAFRIYEEYVEGAIRIGDGASIILTFWSQPPSEWKDKYLAKIERVEKGEVVYSVIINDETKIEEFIKEEMPAFEEYIKIARAKFNQERRGTVVRLPKKILFDTRAERELRLSEFRKMLKG